MKKVLFSIVLFSIAAPAFSQSIWATLASPAYSQSFDSLAKTGQSSNLPFAWYFFEQGDITYADGLYETDCFNTAPNIYSLGDDTTAANPPYNPNPDNIDRALGSKVDANFLPYSKFGLKVTNGELDTAITGFSVSYKGETWYQIGAPTQVDTLMFYYSVDADSLGDTSAAWIPVRPLSYLMQVGLDTPNLVFLNYAGNLPENSKTIMGTLTSAFAVNPGESFYIAWQPKRSIGVQSGLAGVDDLSITFLFGAQQAGVGDVLAGKFSVSSYPNPVYSDLNIELQNSFSEIQWYLTNSLGQRLKNGKFDPVIQGRRTERIDMGGLPSGMYLIHLSNNKGQQELLRFSKQ